MALFDPVDRTTRQLEGKRKWLLAKGKGTLEYPTGVGKTYTAILCLLAVLKKYPNFKVIVVVPTTGLYNQWVAQLDKHGLSLNCQVLVVNTAIKDDYKCDILIVDEIHRMAADTFKDIFKTIKYRLILGLTATFDRLDGKQDLIKKYCPVVDYISPEEALQNKWVSEYKEYLVLVDVDDIDLYKGYNKAFTEHFEFFNYDFKLALSMVGKAGVKNRIAYTDSICDRDDREKWKEMFKAVTYHAVQFTKVVQDRKAFINNHIKKVELARKIIEARPDKKIITFSNSIDMAESIGYGIVYSGKDSKKKERATLDSLASGDVMVVNTSQKANEGLDIPGLSVAIILGLDSSKIKATQRRGRVIRKEDKKIAEIFNIVINNTVEVEWFKNSHDKNSYITIGETGLEQVLRGEEPELYKRPVPKLSFRF